MNISCLGWFTYYYLGYMLGNGFLKIKVPALKILLMWIGAIALQILEGYWYYSMGERNCGTQLKLTAILSGVLFSLLAYRYITAQNTPTPKVFHLLGEYSFGIFFSHLAVMVVLRHIPYYREYVVYPLNAIVTVFVTTVCVALGRAVCGKYAKYLAL